jgi:hypothetical protein
MFRSLSHFR